MVMEKSMYRSYAAFKKKLRYKIIVSVVWSFVRFLHM